MHTRTDDVAIQLHELTIKNTEIVVKIGRTAITINDMAIKQKWSGNKSHMCDNKEQCKINENK